MTSKYINNATYATSGYTLSGVFKSITIGVDGTIGGPGIIGGTKSVYTIDNRGLIKGTSRTSGIILLDGGTVVNSGTIISAGIDISYSNVNEFYAGIVVNSGFIESPGLHGVSAADIINTAKGTIDTEASGYFVTNSGDISEVHLAAGEFSAATAGLTNNAGGLIGGVYGGGNSISVFNDGTITDGVELSSGFNRSTVTNAAHGVIEASAGGTGLYTTNFLSIVNSGTVRGGSVGVKVVDTYLLNKAGALIAGDNGLYIDGRYPMAGGGFPGPSTNAGTIEGTNGYGVTLAGASPILTNAFGGVIEGVIGVGVSGKTSEYGTLINFGTIKSIRGPNGTAVLAGNTMTVLVDEAGSVFIGKVIGEGNTLELAGTNGHLSGLGSSFSGFGSVDVVAGASWTITGSNSLATAEALSVAGGGTLVDTGTITTATGLVLGSAGGGAGHFEILAHHSFDLVGDASLRFAVGGDGDTVNNGFFERTGGPGESIVRGIFDNNGTVAVAAGTLDFSGQVVGSGHLSIGGTGTLEFDLTVPATETVTFAGSPATLLLTDVSAFKAAIDGFDASASGDKIDVTGFDKGTTVKFTQPKSGETVATLTDGKATAAVALFGQYSAAGFGFTASSTGTVITYATPPAEVALAGSSSTSHR